MTGTRHRMGRIPEDVPVYDISPNIIQTYNHLKKAIETHTAVKLVYIGPYQSGTTRVVSPYKLYRSRVPEGLSLVKECLGLEEQAFNVIKAAIGD